MTKEIFQKLGDLDVYLVDGSKIRKLLDIDFTNFGHHYRFDFIPENELWIDTETEKSERRFFIDHLLVERKLMKDGVSYEKALKIADKIEKADRKVYCNGRSWSCI